MRIAYVNANYQKDHTGGGHVHMGQFIKNALELGHEVWVYPDNQYPGVNIIPTSRLDHIKSMRKMDAVYIRLEKRAIDIIRWSLPPRRWLYGFPVVVWEFNTLPVDIEDKIKNNVKNQNDFYKYSRGCDLAVCVSPSLAQIVKDMLCVKRIVTVPNGSDPELFKPNLPIVSRLISFQQKFNVVWIGTIKEKWHDLETIADAARYVERDNKAKDIVFHIIGAGLTNFMADMPPNVFYWGAQHYERLPNWLSVMDVGLSLYKPSRAQLGSPLKIFDYMSSGLAVISTDHPYVNDILHQINGSDYIVPFGDGEVLARKILKLYHDQEQVERLGIAGRNLIVEEYNWKRAVSNIIDAIDKISKDKSVKH